MKHNLEQIYEKINAFINKTNSSIGIFINGSETQTDLSREMLNDVACLGDQLLYTFEHELPKTTNNQYLSKHIDVIATGAKILATTEGLRPQSDKQHANVIIDYLYSIGDVLKATYPLDTTPKNITWVN